LTLEEAAKGNWGGEEEGRGGGKRGKEKKKIPIFDVGSPIPTNPIPPADLPKDRRCLRSRRCQKGRKRRKRGEEEKGEKGKKSIIYLPSGAGRIPYPEIYDTGRRLLGGTVAWIPGWK